MSDKTYWRVWKIFMVVALLALAYCAPPMLDHHWPIIEEYWFGS